VTAQQLFNALFNAGIFVMVTTLVASLGMGFTVSQVLAPLRRVEVVGVALAINLLVVPAVAWGLAELFPIDSAQVVGIVLCCIAAAGPAGLKGAELSKRADMAFAVSLVVVLMLANLVAAPLWAKAVVTGATVSAGTIIEDLLLLVLIPLVIGLFCRARYAEHAPGWKTVLEKISNISLYFAIVLGLAINWSAFTSLLGSWTIVTAVVMVVVFVALGFLIGLKDPSLRLTGAMVTGMRFQPLGFVIIATQLHNNPAYLAPALVFALINTIVVFVIGAELGRLAPSGRRHARKAPAAAAAPPVGTRG
jgi:BASS family bile acid:Na+ symporter